jgi:hypothetical protein
MLLLREFESVKARAASQRVALLLAGGEGVGEEWWMERRFVHGEGGGGQRSVAAIGRAGRSAGVWLLYSTRRAGMERGSRLNWRVS